jgi:hypothetical protein
MFCTLGLVFGCTEGVGSRFHVLRARTRFRPYRGRRVPFTCFALLDSFSAVTRASGPVYMFCTPRLFFGGNEGVGSRFHILRARTCFLLYRGLRVPISCFVLLDLFTAVPRSSSPVLIYCESGHVFYGTEGVLSIFHVLRARTRFRRYRVRRVPFTCFARSDSFLAVPRASGHVFIFYAPKLIFDGTVGVGSRFFVLRARTRFWLYRGSQIQFSCFDSFSALMRESDPFIMFCAPGLVFGRTEGVGSRLHVLRSRTRFRW